MGLDRKRSVTIRIKHAFGGLALAPDGDDTRRPSFAWTITLPHDTMVAAYVVGAKAGSCAASPPWLTIGWPGA